MKQQFGSPRRGLTLAGTIATLTLGLLIKAGLSPAEAIPPGQRTMTVAGLHSPPGRLTADAGAHGSMDSGSVDHGSVDHDSMDQGSVDQGSVDQGSVDHDSMDHDSMDQGSMDHSQMNHGSLAVPPEEPKPSLELSIEPDALRGWNLQLHVENFEFAPGQINQSSLTGEGHAHLFINGEKVTRLYGPWYYIPALPEGEHELRVELNANGHEVLTVDGKPVAATVQVVVPMP